MQKFRSFNSWIPWIVLVLLVMWTESSYLFHIYPPIGTYIAVLAFWAVYVTICPPGGPWGKAAWIVIFAAVMILEVHNLYRDREEHDREQTATRAEQLRSFNEIAKGIDTAISNSQRQFDATMKRTDSLLTKEASVAQLSQEAIYATTGGNSFCYMVFPEGSINSNVGNPAFLQQGRYTVYGVSARVTDLWKLAETKQPESLKDLLRTSQIFQLGDLGQNAVSVNPAFSVSFSDHQNQRFNVFFSSDRNGFWTEELRLYRVSATHWARAIKVFRNDKKRDIPLMKPIIDKDYPVESSSGVIDWR